MILLCQLVSLIRPFVVIVNLLHLQSVIHSASPVWVPWPEYSVEDILQVLIVFAVESLELDFALLFPERHILLRVLPILVVLATSSEKDSESLYKRVKINRLINIFKVINSYRDFQNSKGLRSYNDLSAKTSVFFFSSPEWSSNSCISRSPSFSCCNHERIVNILPEVFHPNSSSQSSITSWASISRGTRISFVIFIYLYNLNL